MIPEDAESLVNSHSLVKASTEKPVQVSGQPPQVVYVNKMKTLSHHDTLAVAMVPMTPSLRTYTKSQHTNMCTTNATPEEIAITWW